MLRHNDLIQESIVLDFGSVAALEAIQAQKPTPKFKVMAQYDDDDWEESDFKRYTHPIAAYGALVSFLEEHIEEAINDGDDPDDTPWTYRVEVA